MQSGNLSHPIHPRNISPNRFLLYQWCPTFLGLCWIWLWGKQQMNPSLLYNQGRMEEVKDEVTECTVPVLWRSNKILHGNVPESCILILLDWIWCWLMDSGSWLIQGLAGWFSCWLFLVAGCQVDTVYGDNWIDSGCLILVLDYWF